MSKKYISLEELINLSLKKFSNDFSEKLFLEQLIYWDDVEDYEITFLNKEVPSEKIKEFLEKEVKAFKNKTLG